MQSNPHRTATPSPLAGDGEGQQGQQGQQGLSLTLPCSWRGLLTIAGGRHWPYVLKLLAAGLPPRDVAARYVLRQMPAHTRERCKPAAIVPALAPLEFLATLPDEPVRPDRLGGGTALSADFMAETYETYIVASNLYTGLLMQMANQQSPAPALLPLLQTLWPGYTPPRSRTPPLGGRRGEAAGEGLPPRWHALCAIVWMHGLTAALARQYPHLFRPAATPDGSGCADPPDPREQMETQLRALTQGDITRRPAVLAAPLPAALYELEQLAREAAEAKKSNK